MRLCVCVCVLAVASWLRLTTSASCSAFRLLTCLDGG